MNEPSGAELGRLDLDLARRIDAACRRFEADRRAGKALRSWTSAFAPRPVSPVDEPLAPDAEDIGPTRSRAAFRPTPAR